MFSGRFSNTHTQTHAHTHTHTHTHTNNSEIMILKAKLIVVNKTILEQRNELKFILILI